MSSSAIQYSTELLAGESPLQALQRASELPENIIIEAAAKGAVWVSLARGRGKTRPRRLHALDGEVSEHSTMMLNFDPEVLKQIPQPMHCVDEHKNYAIWFKPAGMLCQGSKWSDHTVATQVASTISGRHCYLVHRLDKAASGLLLMAYTKNALTSLAALFEKRQIDKHYRAIVNGKFNESLPLAINEPVEGKAARTTVHAASPKDDDNTSILSLSIDTGRKHQIRRHLAGLGYPIVGDKLYGDTGHKESPENSENIDTDYVDLQLMATQLAFVCPFTQRKVSASIEVS